MRKSFLAALCAAVCVPGVATSSENFPLSFTALGIEGSYVDSGNSDDKSTAKDNLDNYFEGGLNLSHQFNPNWSVLLQASYAEPETRTTNLDIDLMRFSAGGRVHPTKFRMAGWRPFGGLGYSYTDLEVEDVLDTKEDAIYLEGGFQRMIAPRFMFEAGIRARTEIEDGYVDGQYFAGIYYVFNREYPKAPRPAAVTTTRTAITPPPKDTDGDGVIDDLDKCADTPKGALVDSDGCPKKLTKQVRKTLYVEFEHDKTEVRPEFFPEIGKLAKLLKQYPNSTILLEGHTDSTGSSTYNQNLSKSRADAVMKVLINEFGIDRNRITTSGMGESQPIASNESAEGRAKNRRVEAIVSGKYSEILKK